MIATWSALADHLTTTTAKTKAQKTFVDAQFLETPYFGSRQMLRASHM
jgi:hypothetical protein